MLGGRHHADQRFAVQLQGRHPVASAFLGVRDDTPRGRDNALQADTFRFGQSGKGIVNVTHAVSLDPGVRRRDGRFQRGGTSLRGKVAPGFPATLSRP
ncbi:hypothetical protein GCM10011577_23910 [Pseudarthrobacter polychromogenes]|uniref:Uncharacterized protein n=1 Tax=Pseudarthrobacter polychromogenes TaxID=1676 RepID=A0ABQ1XPP4_9MICC|nr:hypothetical protein GCM10011577_23910 [Pseudarthrobacter polychromogenes]